MDPNMKSTHGWPRLSVPAGPDDPFDDLRASYYTRLRSDCARLTRLHVQMFRPEMDPAARYDSIRAIAHGMAGAAAVFGVTEVMNAAVTLERAALAATKSRAVPADPTVHAALDALTDLLQSIGEAPRLRPVARPTT